MPQYRAEQVGSFLRPPALLEAHAAFASGRLPLEALREAEDKAILGVLTLQESVGVDVFSDGEFRRSTWAGDFVDAVDGYVPGEPPIALRWRGQSGAARTAGPTTTRGSVIGERLRQKHRLTAHESGFLASHAPGPFKVTMPAPSYIVARGFKPGVTDRVYKDRAEVLAAVSKLVQADVKALVDEGVRYIQIDNPHYPDYVEEEHRKQWRQIGLDPDKALIEDIEADNACLRGFDRSQVTLAMHLCRGNGGQAGWHIEGGYDPIAEQVFGSIEVDRWLLEYDSERAGGFEPLRYVPKDRVVVLGLITTKSGLLEGQDELLRRIEEASAFMPLEQLALSPQCGFASVMQGNPLSADEQRRKLELVVSTARRVWGAGG